jgi:NAD(P)-dependent dehydrogenase (short-subunit alcohol dehydrogenase family)
LSLVNPHKFEASVEEAMFSNGWFQQLYYPAPSTSPLTEPDYEQYYQYMTGEDEWDEYTPPSLKRKADDTSLEPPKKCAKFVQTEMHALPPEVMGVIFLFIRNNQDLFNMITTSKAFYEYFVTLRKESIDTLRLWYLNGRDSQEREVDARVIKLLENSTLQNSDQVDQLAITQDAFVKSFHEVNCTNDESYIGTHILRQIFELNKTCQQQFVVAGGSVFNGINQASALRQSTTNASDIDVFILDYGRPIEESELLVRNLLENLDQIVTQKYFISWYMGTINFHQKNSDLPMFQIVLHRKHSVEELLLLFDLDCARFAFDGQQVYTTREGIRSLITKKNLVPSRHINNSKYSKRVEKYEQRGYWTSFHTIHALDHLFPENYWAHTNFKYFPSKHLHHFEEEEDENWYNYPRTFNAEYSDYENLYEQGPEKYRGVLTMSKRHLNMTVAKTFGALFTLNCSSLMSDTQSYDYHLMMQFFITRCYLCGKYRQLFSLSDCTDARNGMCFDCDQANYQKTFISRNLRRYVAVVTGARVKIGFHVALKLLRAGARVVATTRFVADAQERYEREKDYLKWHNRLEIYPLDLRHANAVISFCNMLAKKYQHVNILINNAAQTVRRPAQFYKDVILKEKEQILVAEKALMHNNTSRIISIAPEQVALRNRSLEYTLSYLEPDTNDDLFPLSQVDKFNEQIDLRRKNSWNSKLEELSMMEIAEVQVINNVSPTLIVAIILPLMTVKSDGMNIFARSYIVNVTSTEGQFVTIAKTDDHAHTNMSKAALNMLTRSSAAYYAKKGIIMNSVDPGWVSSGLPTFRPAPLTVEDGASRIVYPIFMNETRYGKLFKDYEEVPW